MEAVLPSVVSTSFIISLTLLSFQYEDVYFADRVVDRREDNLKAFAIL